MLSEASLNDVFMLQGKDGLEPLSWWVCLAMIVATSFICGQRQGNSNRCVQMAVGLANIPHISDLFPCISPV